MKGWKSRYSSYRVFARSACVAHTGSRYHDQVIHVFDSRMYVVKTQRVDGRTPLTLTSLPGLLEVLFLPNRPYSLVDTLSVSKRTKAAIDYTRRSRHDSLRIPRRTTRSNGNRRWLPGSKKNNTSTQQQAVRQAICLTPKRQKRMAGPPMTALVSGKARRQRRAIDLR